MPELSSSPPPWPEPEWSSPPSSSPPPWPEPEWSSSAVSSPPLRPGPEWSSAPCRRHRVAPWCVLDGPRSSSTRPGCRCSAGRWRARPRHTGRRCPRSPAAGHRRCPAGSPRRSGGRWRARPRRTGRRCPRPRARTPRSFAPVLAACHRGPRAASRDPRWSSSVLGRGRPVLGGGPGRRSVGGIHRREHHRGEHAHEDHGEKSDHCLTHGSSPWFRFRAPISMRSTSIGGERSGAAQARVRAGEGLGKGLVNRRRERIGAVTGRRSPVARSSGAASARPRSPRERAIVQPGTAAAAARADWRLGFEDLRREVRIGRLDVDGRLPHVAAGHPRSERARPVRGREPHVQPLVRRAGHAARLHDRPGPRGVRQPLPPQLGLPSREGGGHHSLLRVRHRPLPGDLQRRPGHLLAGQGGRTRMCTSATSRSTSSGLTEVGLPVRFDPRTLRTLGVLGPEPPLGRIETVHPHRLPGDRRVFYDIPLIPPSRYEVKAARGTRTPRLLASIPRAGAGVHAFVRAHRALRDPHRVAVRGGPAEDHHRLGALHPRTSAGSPPAARPSTWWTAAPGGSRGSRRTRSSPSTT